MEETTHSLNVSTSGLAFDLKRWSSIGVLWFVVCTFWISAIDACPFPSSTLPIYEDFESNSLLFWEQDPNDDFNWAVNSGGTPSSGTGPSGAFDGTYYLYTEATSPNNPDRIANLISPCFTVPTGEISYLEFAYHMYGSGMGTFNLDISTDDGSTWINLWSLSGDQGNLWYTEAISLEAYEGQAVKLRYNVITGTFRSDVSVDNVNITSRPGCFMYSPYTGFPIDFLGDHTGWIDYDLSGDFGISDNGDGTMQIEGMLDNANPVDFGSGSNGTTCGANDGWIVSLTISDRKSWEEWQALGGSAYLNPSCPGIESGLDYWDVSGTLTGIGCNAGRTVTITSPKFPYRFQIGIGGNSGDNTCSFGMSTWFEINEGGTIYQSDIYALMDETCYNEIVPSKYCESGYLYVERWFGIGGSNVSNLTSDADYPDSPSEIDYITSFQGPVGYSDNYGTRVRGFIIPSETGNYKFNVTGDDNTILYLSTDHLESNKVEIASVSGWSNITEHNKYGSQTSSQITLTAGVSYYVELLHKEGGGGDHFQVYWRTPSVPSSWNIIPGVNLFPFGCDELCENGIDDDGDGMVDCDDEDCFTSGNVVAATGDVRNGAASNAIGWPDNVTTEVGASSDYLVVTFDQEIPAGTEYTIYISGRNGNATTDVWEAPEGTVIPTSQQDTPSGFTLNGQATGPQDVVIPVVKNTLGPTRYIYFDRGGGDIEIDAVTYTIPCEQPEVCGNGLDDDGNGLIDCLDPACPMPEIDAGVISGDEISCVAFNAGEIQSYSDPVVESGTYTLQWQVSTDTINWTDIAGATGLNYTPATISDTTYFRRVLTSSLCTVAEFYSNIIAKIVNSDLSICPEDEDITFACTDGFRVSPTGVGITGMANPSVRVLNPTLMEYYIVEATFSGGAGATESVIFSTTEGDQRVVNKTYFAGESGSNGNRYFKTILPPSDSIFLSYDGDPALAESFVVYTVSSIDDYESFAKSVHQELSPGETYQVSFPLTPSINGKAVFANASLSGIVDDGSEIYLHVYGGGVSQIDTITAPNEGNTLNVEFVNLLELSPTADSLHMEIISPPGNGQTALISGYLAAIVECDRELVVTAETDADCIKVGDTITYNYTVYNFADVEFQNFSATSSLGGEIDFGITTIPANSQYDTTQNIIITNEMLMNTPVVNDVFVFGWNFSFGIKPRSDGFVDTLKICEICDNGIDDDEDGLTDCLDPDCGGNVSVLNQNMEICINESIQLQSTEPGGTWSSDNASIAIVSSNGLAVGIAAGATTFTYTTPSGCVVTTGTLTVDSGVDVTIDFNGSLCLTDDSQLSALVSGGTSPYTYAWSGPNGFTGNTQTIDADLNGNYTVTVTDDKGCSTNSTAFIYEAYDPFIFTLNSEVCEGESVSLSVSGASGATYAWDANANNASTSGVTVVPSFPSTAYSVTVTNSIGCATTATAIIDVIAKPVVDINGIDEICVGGTTQLSPSSAGVWTSSNVGVANVNSSGLVTGIGSGSATFTFEDSATGCTSDPTSAVTVNTNAIVNLSGDDQICVGESTTLNTSVSGGSWSINNTSVATINASTGEITPLAQGSATVTYEGPVSGCYMDASYSINVFNAPVLSVNGPSTICEGSITYLSATTSGSWVSSDETVAVISGSGEVTGIGAGTASFTFTSVTGCQQTLSTPITVIANPSVSLTGSGSICINETTTLSPSSGGVWISNNPAVATVSNAGQVIGQAQGIASFTFIDNTYGCIADETITVVVNPTPTINALSSSAICEGEIANITPATGGVWTSTNPSIATITNAGMITGIAAGTIQFIYTHNMTGCSSLPSGSLTVESPPTISFSAPTELCSGETLSISPDLGGAWSSTDVSVATISNSGMITAEAPGEVQFIFTDASTGCVSDSSAILTVTQPTTVSIIGPDAICVGEVTQLSPTSGGSWSSSDATVATVTSSGEVTALAAGVVSFIFQDSTGCNSAPTADVVVGSIPNPSFSGLSTICVGETTTLNPTTGGVWVSSDTTVAIVENNGLVTAQGVGAVSFTYTSFSGCTAVVDSDLTVNALPEVNIIGDDEICIGGSTSLEPASGGVWISSDNTVASITPTGVVTGVSAGNVTFTYIESSTGCYSESSETITVLERPSTDIGSSNTLCVGSTTNILPSTDGTWVSNNDAVATITNAGLVTGVSQGLARFTFTSTKGCESHVSAPIIVIDEPNATIEGPSVICLEGSAQLLPNSGGSWTSLDPSLATITDNGIVTPVAEGSVSFVFTDSNSGCVSNASAPVTILPRDNVTLDGPDEICIGGTTQMLPAAGGVWTSLNPTIASIQNNGEIVGVSVGTARFLYQDLSTGCYADTSVAITVLPGPNTAFDGDVNVCLGDTIYITPSSGGVWFSTNTEVATVTNTGMIVAQAPGNVRFQFTETTTGCKSALSDVLTVRNVPGAGISGPPAICLGGQTNLSPSSGGVWQSLNPTIATVDSNGIVSGQSVGMAYFAYTDSTTGCSTNGNLTIEVESAAPIEINGGNTVCLGYTTTLSPTGIGIWTSSNPEIATVSNTGVVTGHAPGTVTFDYVDPLTGCASPQPSDPVTVVACTNHDFNVTLKDETVVGNLRTNDHVPIEAIYGSGFTVIDKPASSIGLLSINLDGTYSFVANRAGKYLYKIPVCLSASDVVCEGTILEINVVEDVYDKGNAVANLEFTTTFADSSSTKIGQMVIIETIANDTCVYAGSCNLDKSTLTILNPPNHGTASINSDHQLTYTPQADFIGVDTIDYRICLDDGITCNQSQHIILVNHHTAQNSVVANDDFYYTLRETTVTGNLLKNDADPEGEVIAVDVVGSSASPITISEGSYFIESDGFFSFTPNADFTGTVDIVYTVCDENLNCTDATVHLLVLDDLSIQIRVYLEGAMMNNGGAQTLDGLPLMRDDLRVSPFTGKNYLPLSDPYSFKNELFVDTKDQFTKMGAGLMLNNQFITDSLAVFSVEGADAIVDWVHVEMRSKEDSTQVISTRSGLVQRDGDIVDLDGKSNLRFQGIFADSFYIAVKHRSHLGVMSQLVSNDELVDFTDPDFPVFNFGTSLDDGFDYSGLSQNYNVVDGYAVLWAGDFDSNGKVKFTNPDDDQNIMLFGVLFSSPGFFINYNNAYGYLTSDYNMNSKAKYTNPNDDLNLLFSQVLLYPLNTQFLSNFNAMIEQVPQ